MPPRLRSTIGCRRTTREATAKQVRLGRFSSAGLPGGNLLLQARQPGTPPLWLPAATLRTLGVPRHNRPSGGGFQPPAQQRGGSWRPCAQRPQQPGSQRGWQVPADAGGWLGREGPAARSAQRRAGQGSRCRRGAAGCPCAPLCCARWRSWRRGQQRPSGYHQGHG